MNGITTTHEIGDTARLSHLAEMLRCLECGSPIEVLALSIAPGYPDLGPDGRLGCTLCGETYPLIAGTPRMLDRSIRARLRADYPLATGAFADDEPAAAAPVDGETCVKQQTADTFAYEWRQFGRARAEWRKNFLDYMRPHDAKSFCGRVVLDVGAGSGRHSLQAARLGADVVAVDLGGSIDVARQNLPAEVLTVQADAERLPFAPASFDFVMSIGVLHHLPDPERALRSIARYARPSGHVHIYLYWMPELAAHQRVLSLVTALRSGTVRLPHRLLHALCYPLSGVLFGTIVLPYRAARNRPRTRRLANLLPLKAYADYPFGVLVNDQFDRFSAPLEHRYTRAEVAAMVERAGLVDVQVLPNSGWVADGRVRSMTPAD